MQPTDSRPGKPGPPIPTDLATRLAEGPPLLLDGATGTELERRGAHSRLPLWSAHALLDDPDLVRRIHADYAQAGAEILTANTFRTQRRALSRGGLGERAGEFSALAVELARSAAAEAAPHRRVLVVGSAPTLEDCYRPDRVPHGGALASEHAEHAEHLAAAGVDAILVETMNTSREAVAAVRAAQGAGVPVMVSFVCGPGARLLSGEALRDALAVVAEEGPLAVLVNCLPASQVAICLPALRGCGLPFGAYANLGEPEDEVGFARSEDCTPEEFAEWATACLADGARIVGGCCGTTPAHLRAIAQRMRR